MKTFFQISFISTIFKYISNKCRYNRFDRPLTLKIHRLSFVLEIVCCLSVSHRRLLYFSTKKNEQLFVCQNNFSNKLNGENGYNTFAFVNRQNLVCLFYHKRKINYWNCFYSCSTIQHNSTIRNNQNEISSSTTIDMLKDCCNNKLVKTSDKHAKFLLENLNLLRKQKELCDVILIIGQNKIPAHRAVLSGKDQYRDK